MAVSGAMPMTRLAGKNKGISIACGGQYFRFSKMKSDDQDGEKGKIDWRRRYDEWRRSYLDGVETDLSDPQCLPKTAQRLWSGAELLSLRIGDMVQGEGCLEDAKTEAIIFAQEQIKLAERMLLLLKAPVRQKNTNAQSKQQIIDALRDDFDDGYADLSNLQDSDYIAMATTRLTGGGEFLDSCCWDDTKDRKDAIITLRRQVQFAEYLLNLLNPD